MLDQGEFVGIANENSSLGHQGDLVMTNLEAQHLASLRRLRFRHDLAEIGNGRELAQQIT
jgi:hypothetical protein